MSSFKNAIPRRAHKERAQPQARKKFGLLEKHKDYVVRATAFHKKEQTLQKLKEKAAFRNPDEFYFKMVKTKTVDGVHKLESQANKYTPEELMLMKTQDIGYILQKVQSEKKKIEKLTAMLHSLDNQPSNKRVYYAEDRRTNDSLLYGISLSRMDIQALFTNYLQILPNSNSVGPNKIAKQCHIQISCFLCSVREEAEELASKVSERSNLAASGNLPSSIRSTPSSLTKRSQVRAPLGTESPLLGCALPPNGGLPGANPDLVGLQCGYRTPKTATSYRELEARKSRVRDLEKVYMDMAMQKELQKSGRKRKLREEELVNPTSKPVYKWRQERKR
ncbi:hypothetical protein H5410_054152 [Solanum commersonii]|uniref:U3 small nucleolar RNA-associated protein 11 n=1 Tax=Solanum commersonii TaxID=4109 RepID=A0A9J5X7S7_SOLCO|nr:hypothetical protein H5410_054152 [Solanum commersonii]